MEKPDSDAPDGADGQTIQPNGPDGNGANSVPDQTDGADSSNTTISSVSDLSGTLEDVYQGFDPAIHAVDADGKPKKKPDGTWAKKRGRKAGTSTPSGAAGSALPPKRASTNESAPSMDSGGLSSEAAARQFTNAFIHGGVMLFGADWEPDDKAEPQELKNALKDYFDADGVPNIPPWFGVVIAFGSYSAKRLMKPTIQERVYGFYGRIKSLMGRKFSGVVI